MHPTRHCSPDSTRYNRRGFLKTSLSAGAFAASYPYLDGYGIPAGLARSFRDVSHFDLGEMTIADLQADMESGKYTARSITEKFIARIGEIDRGGPSLNSVIELNPDAAAIADALDAERKKDGPRGPLHGIPVLIKDNIDSADRMATTAGSLALLDSKPSKDAFIVQKLRTAGTVILGKTNLSEWANIRSSRSTSGWSGRGGLTRNPYALDRNTSGSSSGSAAAVSAGLCPAAVGTETDGSIVSPSSVNGIVGIKPTVGLVSRSGVIPISDTQDTPGPMARTVTDAAILLGALAGPDTEDGATSAGDGNTFTDYTRFLDPRGLSGSRIGVARFYFGFLDSVDRLIDGAIGAMREQGAVIIDLVDISSLSELGDAEITVLLYELKAGMQSYLARSRPTSPRRTLGDIIGFNEKNRKTEMPYFGQDLFMKAELKGPLTSSEYLDALAKCRRLASTEGIDAAMKKYNLDAIVAPTDGPAWPTDLVNGDHYIGGSSTAAAVARTPSITVPAGEVFGLPVGVSFFAGAWSEPALIRMAYSFEQATKLRKSPRFLPTIGLPLSQE